jgi:hypothetical protein
MNGVGAGKNRLTYVAMNKRDRVREYEQYEYMNNMNI